MSIIVVSGILAAAEVEEGELVQADFSKYKEGPKSWPYNHLPYSTEMWRWRADEAVAATHSTSIVKALQESTAGKANGLVRTYTTEKRNEEFSVPIYIGQSTDSEFTYKYFGNFPKIHRPSGLLATETDEGDWGFILIDGPTQRALKVRSKEPTQLSPTEISQHDLSAFGGGISANHQRTTEGLTPKEPVINVSSPAFVASATEAGLTECAGPSAARVDYTQLFVRFPQLAQAGVNWRNAIPHAMYGLVHHECMRRRTTTEKYHEQFGSILTSEGSPKDGRLPYAFPARQGEVSFGANEFLPPSGQWFRLSWTQAEIEAMTSVPSWVKAVLLAMHRYGIFNIDTGGTSEGNLQPWAVESQLSYFAREGATNYATTWMTAHEDGKWLVKTGTGSERKWSFDITGNGILSGTEFYSHLEALKPPARPTFLDATAYEEV